MTRAFTLLLFILCTFSLPLLCSNTQQSNFKEKLREISNKQVISQAKKYTFSDAIKDIALAYCVTFFITFVHELGHGLTGKLLFNSPLNITIGGYTDTPMTKAMGITIAGFNPLQGFATITYPAVDYNPLKKAFFYFAGPLFGTIASYIILRKLVNIEKLLLTKYMALIELVSNPLQIIPIPFFPPTYDGNGMAKSLKEYFNGT